MGILNVPLNGTRLSRRKYPYRYPLSVPLLAVVLFFLVAQFRLIPNPLNFGSSINDVKLYRFQLDRLEYGLQKCAEFNTPPVQYNSSTLFARTNSRWNSITGQKQSITLKNVTLFDGDSFLNGAVNVVFSKGVVKAVYPTSEDGSHFENVNVLDLGGKYVTPGLVDMHSHHLVGVWPALPSVEDTNEINDAFKTLTPFVRSLDSIKPYDVATTIIRSGGVTSALILPGSANVMGGEAYIVKNVLRGGVDHEESVEEMLLEHGLPQPQRRRYMKMACGENPRRVYKHTRMGNAWIFRNHMERAVELKARQDEWCLVAANAHEKQDRSLITHLTTSSLDGKGGLPEQLELDSSVGMLRGQVGVNIHCYEPEDFEDMLLHSKEFGFRIQAFHHALSAWKVPEMIKKSGQNITIATFSDFSLYKQEAYGASLYAGKVLSEHGVPVAYKSDHGGESTNAKYLLFEAATAHSFGLPEIKALQSVTSVPAKSLEQDHRIGYVKVGYDADIVVWDSHPLSIGATPLQVYVDGKATFDTEKVKESMMQSNEGTSQENQPRIRPMVSKEFKDNLCNDLEKRGSKVFVTGISKSYLPNSKTANTRNENLTALIEHGRVKCLDVFGVCASSQEDVPTIHLRRGYLLPGLTAVSRSLGILEIGSEASTQDGSISTSADVSNPANVVHAKYGVHLEGRAFKRAQIGGVTRSITLPISRGFLGGVSTGIKTSEKKTTLNGGIFKSDVALHLAVGQKSKRSDSTPSVSLAVSKVRKILLENDGKDNIFGSAANGSIPLVIDVENKYDIMQMIKLKQDFKSINLIIYGGAEAPAVAAELSEANIPVIITHNRGAPASFETKDLLVGPPLTRSAVSVLAEANVTFALAIDNDEGDSGIYTLPLEARWAAKYAGLSDHAAIDLVSRNIESILGIEGNGYSDVVLWEGNPLELGASVVLSLDADDGAIMSCWPVSK